MGEDKSYCGTCKKEMDVIERNQDAQIELLSCGHRNHLFVASEIVNASDFLNVKHLDSSKKLKARYKTKISGETKRPAIDNLEINRAKGIKVHQVWEEDQDGTKKLVHNEETPLKTADKKD